jgi:hypothetical protein
MEFKQFAKWVILGNFDLKKKPHWFDIKPIRSYCTQP